MPIGIERGGLVGPRLTTVIAYLKGVCHASFSTVRKFVRDVLRLTISRGQLANIIAKVSQALEQPYQELLESLPDQKWLNVDETGHKQNRLRQWTWCFRAGLYTLFKIDPTRSADVLIEVLGAEFNGVLGCDYFSAYRRYLREFDVSLQFCLAHLIRDVKFLTTLPDARDRMYGTRLREALRELFGVIHRRELLTAERFQAQLEAARAKVLRCGTHNVPATNHCRNLAKRFAEHGENYFRFITTPGVEPTNNQPRPEAVVLGRPPEGAVYVRLPPLGAWSWSGPGFSQAPTEASPLMTNSRLIQCHARVLPNPDQNGKSTPDRSKLFGSHGQRPWF